LLGNPNSPVSNPKGSWTILSVHVVLDNVVDLTDGSQQRVISTTESELTGNWTNYPGVSPTQELGGALFNLPDVEGFIFKSSKVDATCLAIFPDKLTSRSSFVFINEMTNRKERMT